MDVPRRNLSDLTPAEAAQLQRELAAQVSEHDSVGRIRHVAGVDVGFEGENNRSARAAVVVLSFPDLTLVDYAIARGPVRFPYIPGLLAFREAPAIFDAFEKIKSVPDVVIVDGHGRAHPRRMGLACHVGLALNIPTIGCAKSILVGKAEEPAQRVGAWTRLVDEGQIIGAALRTRVRTKPIYVSIGHRVSLERAVQIVLECTKGFRLPETTRYAHRVAGGELPGVKTKRGHTNGN